MTKGDNFMGNFWKKETFLGVGLLTIVLVLSWTLPAFAQDCKGNLKLRVVDVKGEVTALDCAYIWDEMADAVWFMTEDKGRMNMQFSRIKRISTIRNQAGAAILMPDVGYVLTTLELKDGASKKVFVRDLYPGIVGNTPGGTKRFEFRNLQTVDFE
jgi:hypothetical protein